MTAPKSTTLYCTEGSSDKVYQATLQARDSGWVVEFAYGPRGKALKNGSKTNEPVSYEEAAKIYERLIKEKTAKGYTPSDSGVAFVGTEREQQASGKHPELPSPIDLEDAPAYLDDDRYVMQEKHDGENRQVLVSDGVPYNVVRGINRKSLFVPVRSDWDECMRQLPTCLIAGEDMGNQLVAFDLLELGGIDLRPQPFLKRHRALTALVDKLHGGVIMVSPIYVGVDKARRFQEIRGANGEGVVFKLAEAAHSAGVSQSQRKLKFKESATCIVLKHNLQRSVAVGLIDGHGDVQNLGNVTIPANADVPPVHTLIEVEYLYRYANGCFEQPVFLKPRVDLDPSSATVSQIRRIKPRAEAVM